MKKTKRYDGENGSLVEDESDRGSMTAGQQANSDATNAAAKTASSKPAIVTKEQMQKKGFDNLRDYLNDQQGLKRRDGSAPSKSTSKAEAPAPKAETKADNQPKSYADMAKSIPEGTSDAARQALMANLVKERQNKATPKAEAPAPKKTVSLSHMRIWLRVFPKELLIRLGKLLWLIL